MEPIQTPEKEQTDETLCALTASGDRVAEEALVLRYNRLVRICCRPYFLAGGDSEDLLQEGMIGLIFAIRGFDPSRDAGFRTYAEVCIRNRLRSAIKAAAGDRHAPLNHSVSLGTPLFDGNLEPNAFGPDHQCVENPEDVLIDREESRQRLSALHEKLSHLESRILELYLQGLSYQEIALETGKATKSVDNAVQRIRRKIAPQFSFGDFSKS